LLLCPACRGTPDVVDQDIEAAVFVAHLPGQAPHLLRVEVIDLGGDPGAAQGGDQFGRLLDCLRAVVV